MSPKCLDHIYRFLKKVNFMKHLKILLILIFLIIFISLLFKGEKKNDCGINSHLQDLIKKNGEFAVIDFDKLQKGNWDFLYVLTPQRRDNPKITNLPENIFKENPDICVLLFVKDKRVISYVKVENSILDFSLLRPSYQRKEAKFKVQIKKHGEYAGKVYNVIYAGVR